MIALKSSMIDTKAITFLAKNYNTLNYSPELIELLSIVYPNQNFVDCSKYELHQKLNEVLVEYYHGEQTLKYSLFKRYVKKKSYVGAFEIKVNNSRADFLTINGHTTCFEIKSDLDNFSKFDKQAADYSLAFEYNYLVVSKYHMEKAQRILPNHFGLMIFQKGKYREIKRACLNNKIDAKTQLTLLSKREIIQAFREVDGNHDEILKHFTPKTINTRFKKTLKNRYLTRWNFLTLHQTKILPIDIQFFFQTNILPDHVYHH